MIELESLDRVLLRRVQAELPLVPRPFARLADDLGYREPELRARLRRLADRGVLRHLGAIFDTRACGYASTLVAARVASAHLPRAAAVVGRHPGVTHSYERAHAWNLWFTLVVPPASALGLEATVAWLGRAADAESIRALPALRVFKLAARFGLAADEAPGPGAPRPVDAPAERLTGEEIAAVGALQRSLPLVEEPFAALAAGGGLDAGTLHLHARRFLARGVMRRFAALLNHRRAGFGANVMAVWAVPPERLEEAGARAAAFDAVTHCYTRPTFPDWPYGLFSMIHGRSRQDCLLVMDAIRAAIEPDDGAALWSGREFKKTRLQLFTPDYAAWEAAAHVRAPAPPAQSSGGRFRRGQSPLRWGWGAKPPSEER